MKPNETSLNTQENKSMNQHEEDDHALFSMETPLRADAFELDDDLKIELIEKHFKEIMQILGLDLNDDSLKGTPHRVAKMYVKEMFKGLDPKHLPAAKLFENKYQYKNILIEKNISFHSVCEHHFVPIIGKAHVAYIPGNSVVGLSKLNRIVRYFAQRPQVQERMTMQIANMLKEVLQTQDVAVIIEADHMCVAMRGVQDITSSTITTEFCGKFQDAKTREELMRLIKLEA
ncbi:MAG: GTP cyclohydrolase I FolE [Bacteroidetes bacterium]|nr:GTP cyclohydrolase I FolE [Bacteroidota bacterium]